MEALKIMNDYEYFDLDQVIVLVNGVDEYTITDICDIDYDIDIVNDEVVVMLDEYEVSPHDAILYYGDDKQSDIIYDVIYNGETSYDVYPESIAVEQLVLEDY